MGTFGTTLQIIAGLLAIVAIVLHRADHVRGKGTTMGGETAIGAIWTIASLAFSTSIGIQYHWMAILPVAITTYALGRFGVHWLIEKLMFKYDLGRA